MLTQAEALLAQTPPDLAAAERLAQRALIADPLADSAVLLLGRVAAARRDATAMRRLVLRASALSRHDQGAQSWLLDDALRRGAWSEVVDRLDVMWRGRLNAWGELAPNLTAAEIAAPLLAKLAEQPPWRGEVLKGLAQSSRDLDGLIALFGALQQSAAPPTLAELRPYLLRLVAAGRAEDAYLAWLQTLPLERLSRVGLLFNADFRDEPTGLPFDWTLAPVAGAATALLDDPAIPRGKLLAVDFFGGRVAFRHVSQLLVLAPGAYEFRGAQSAQALRNPRGLRWRIACLTDPDRSLGETPPVRGDTSWQAFAVAFSVPDNCGVQSLQLELPARFALEQAISGRAAFRQLAIARQ
jgi:hypothetical protein